MTTHPVLFHHRLSHFGALGVSPALLRRRYAPGCSMANCRGACCRGGVDVDLEERTRILEHADLVKSLMDDGQDQREEHWFGETFDDPDFPSRRAVSTAVVQGSCVFSDRNGRCVLHKAEAMRPGETLKPFYCRAYPLCIEDGVLVLDDKPCSGKTECCGPVEHGQQTIFDVCAEELAYVLGADGVRELRALAGESNAASG